jgi:hypothetical protein
LQPLPIYNWLELSVSESWIEAMTQIVLTSEQDGVFATANEPVAVCRPDGSVAGYLRRKVDTPKEPLFTSEEIAEAERRMHSPGPWYTTKEVLEHLRSLERS